ncbi:surface protein-like [Lineus longissimus]|uniref:surface protein-like n=1 Tax=Lineus longissimus TaxID=88925 RepID=UPI00315DE500
MSKASGQAVERCFERQDLNSPAKNFSIERAEIYETGDQENDEIAVNLPEPLESGNERASQGRRPTGSHDKARRMMREDTVLDDDDGDTTQIKPRRHSRKKLSVVHEEIEEHSGFNSNATANDGVVDYADDDAVSDADDDRDADDDHDADDGDVDAGADEDGDDDENVDNGSANDDDIDDDGREDVDGDVGDDQQNLEEQAAKFSAPLIDEGNEQSDSDKSSSISQGLRRGDGVGLQNVGLENVREDSGQHTVSQGVAEEEDDDHDEQVFVNDDNESVNDAVNQVVEKKENRFEEGSRVFIEKRLGAGTLEKGRKGRLDSFEISGIEPVARDEDEPKAMDKSSGGDKNNKEDGNASRANTTKGGKAKRKRRNVPATTVHVDVRQHMKDRDFIHQQLDILAMPINPTDPLVMNVYNKLTAQNVIDEHPIPKDIVQKVFDKVNKKVYEEVHGAFNPREIQAMLSALDEVRCSTSGAGIDVDRSEKQLVALNVERVLETLPMTWPSTNRGNAAVERYNKLRRHVSKLLASIEDEKKDHVQYKVSVDMVREIRSLQASLDMNALVEEVKRSQHLASQFTKLKKFEKRAKKQESFAD